LAAYGLNKKKHVLVLILDVVTTLTSQA